MAAALIDTNVLVYAHDGGASDKQERAIELLDRLHVSGAGRLSSQCLSEFFAVTTRGKRPLLSIDDAATQVERLMQAFVVLDVTALVVLEAMRGVRERQLAFFDAQLWATARLHQIPLLFSEDFPAGSTLDGVRFINPFARDFQAEAWT